MSKKRKKHIAIFGTTGMLGSMIYWQWRDIYDLTLVYRSSDKLASLEAQYGKIGSHRALKFDIDLVFQDYLAGTKGSGSAHMQTLIKRIGTVDAVVNCAGIIIPHARENSALTLFVNGAFPHLLSRVYQDKLIHITTDCVFSGAKGAPYDENSVHSPTDLYGVSKSLGEPKDRSLVIRTSIIGPEIEGHLSFFDWFTRQPRGSTVRGFTNHVWNGVTTFELAKVFRSVIDQRGDFPKQGLFHVFSQPLTKYDMLQTLKKKLDLDVEVVPVRALPMDRRLGTVYDFCRKLNIPSFERMIDELIRSYPR